jgi:hypothetical protein
MLSAALWDLTVTSVIVIDFDLIVPTFYLLTAEYTIPYHGTLARIWEQQDERRFSSSAFLFIATKSCFISTLEACWSAQFCAC